MSICVLALQTPRLAPRSSPQLPQHRAVARESWRWVLKRPSASTYGPRCRPEVSDQAPIARSDPYKASAALDTDDAPALVPPPVLALPLPSFSLFDPILPASSAPSLDRLLPRACWSPATTLVTLGLWSLFFATAAASLVPAVLSLLGVTVGARASSGEQIARHLTLDSFQLVFTVSLLRLGVRSWTAPGLARGLAPLSAARGQSELAPPLASCHPPARPPLSLWVFPLSSWASVFVVGALLLLPIDAAHRYLLLNLSPSAPRAPSALSQSRGLVLACWALMLTCVAPLWEELIFRGFLLPGVRAAAAQLLLGSTGDGNFLAAHAVDAVAIALCAALFASVHASPMGFAPLFALGLVFGGAYKATGNLLPCVCLHALWNVAMLVRVVMGG